MESKQNNISPISRNGLKSKRIFRIRYEDLSAQIFYDPRDNFQLQLCRDNQCREEILLTREITRAQAFHIMNTRN